MASHIGWVRCTRFVCVINRNNKNSEHFLFQHNSLYHLLIRFSMKKKFTENDYARWYFFNDRKLYNAYFPCYRMVFLNVGYSCISLERFCQFLLLFQSVWIVHNKMIFFISFKINDWSSFFLIITQRATCVYKRPT